MSHGTKRPIGSLDRGLDVLESLAEHGELKLAELPEMLGVSRATAFRILTALQERGYVSHNRESHSYSLGAAALTLGSHSRSATLKQAAEMQMTLLRDRTHETVNLAVFENGRLVYTRILDGTYSLRMSGTVGGEAPLHATALGNAVLATLPDEVAVRLAGPPPYEAFTEKTITTEAELRAAIDSCRKNGYSVDDQGEDLGAVCIGAAIVGPDGAPVGSISVSGPAARLTAPKIKEYGEALVDTALDVTENFAALTGLGQGHPG